MAAPRKLFLTHAGELAHLLVTAIARDAMTVQFLRSYAQRYDRSKVLANPERLREMESTISREALLLIASEVRRVLPRAFGFSGNPRPEERALCDAFYTEFLQALGRALHWRPADAEIEAEAFVKDLETYARWRQRSSSGRRYTKTLSNQSPFPDRCAILLDSGMMEQARRAAAKFQSDLLRLGMRIFGQLGRQSPRRRVQPRAAKPEIRSRSSRSKRIRTKQRHSRRSR